MKVEIREMVWNDCIVIEQAFKKQGWHKSMELYEQYIEESLLNDRDNLIALVNGQFAGYVTIVWSSDYPYFKENKIPEIKDLNVLKTFQRQGIATILLDEAERRIGLKSELAGIGVGLMSDYGSAQRLYIKRGYIPDGLGISLDGRFLQYGDQITVDDDVNLFLVKKLNK